MAGHGLQLGPMRSLKLTDSLRQAIGFLSMSNAQLTSFLEFRAATNPFLSIAQDGGAGSGSKSPSSPVPRALGSGIDPEQAVAAPAGLREHARREAGLVVKDARELAIAERLIDALAPTGWLDEPLERVARSAGCSEARVEAVLKKLQECEPAGLFARSLSECLWLQAREAGELDEIMQAVLDNLPAIAQGRLGDVAARCGADVEDVAERLNLIRGHDPKPGTRFDDGERVTTVPDLVARRTASGWTVALSAAALPEVEIVFADSEEARRGARSQAEKTLLEEARWLKSALERRNLTLLRVGVEMAQRQAAFLQSGASHLKPLRLVDIADALGLHESTVSRVVAHRRMVTPRGTIALRDFFSGQIGGGEEGEGVSVAAVREALRDLIEGEDRSAPFSDQELVLELRSRKIELARRTVAKYREQLGFATSAQRKRMARTRLK